MTHSSLWVGEHCAVLKSIVSQGVKKKIKVGQFSFASTSSLIPNNTVLS